MTLSHATTHSKAAFAAAVLLSKNRRLGLMGVGAAVLVSSILQLVALIGVDEVVTSVILDPENEAAARRTVQVFLIEDLQSQSLLLALSALIVVAGTWVMGGSNLATDIRSNVSDLTRRGAHAVGLTGYETT